jgi:hypothetical protein
MAVLSNGIATQNINKFHFILLQFETLFYYMIEALSKKKDILGVKWVKQ